MKPWLRYSLLAWACANLAACACGGQEGPTEPAPDAGGGQEGERDDRLRESEPNDGPNQATPFVLEARSPGSPLFKPFHGSLSKPGDIDWYRIPAQEAGALRTLQAQTQSQGADLRLFWLVGGEPRLQDIGQAPGLEEVLDLRSDQEVWIGVGAQGGAPPVDYTLTLARSPQPLGVLMPEPEAADEALEVPGRRQGLLNFAGDVDRFVIRRGPQGAQETALRLEFQPPEVATHLVVRDDSGQALVDVQVPAAADAKDKAAGPRVLRWPNLELPAQGSTLLVEISAQEAQLPGAARAWTLGALFHGPVAKGELLEVEPGPLALPEGGGRVLGYLHDAQDEDKVTFSIREPAADAPPWILHARVEGEDLDLALRVGADGDKAELLDEGALGEPELVCNQVASPGLWSALVSRGAKAPEPGEGDRYKLLIELRPAQGEEIEPNQVRAQASALEEGARARGFLYPARDTDLWRFEVSAPQEAPAEDAAQGEAPRKLPRSAPASQAASSPFGKPAPVLVAPATVPVELLVRAPGLNVQLEVLDEDGAPVARQDSRGRGEQEKLRVDLPAGVYFARVSDAAQRGACEEPYQIEWKARER